MMTKKSSFGLSKAQSSSVLVKRRTTIGLTWTLTAEFCLRGGLAIILALLFTGCTTIERYSLTYRLWNSSDFRKFNEPAPDAKVALFERTNRVDVLVQYEAWSENDSIATRKAYYLRANQARIVTGKKPIFVNPSVAERMQPIPVFISNAGFTNMTSPPAPYAVMAKESRAFTLYLEAGRGEAFTLPVYSESSGTVMRVVFTPLAVAGDTVVVAAAGAVVCIIGLAESGTSFDVH